MAADNSNATNPPVVTTGSEVTFYYTAAGTSTVSYSVTTSGQTYQATTTFVVLSPTYTIATATSTVNVNQDNGWQIQLGRSLGTRGVSFTATVTQPTGFSGSSQWVQLVNSFSGKYTPNTLTCTTSGLDTVYPYRSGTSMTDSPNATLAAPFTQEEVSFSFTAYLMWQPSSPSIPVSIAKVNWGWSGTAVFSGSIWALSGAPVVTPPATTAQTASPLWVQVANATNNCH
ncbi:MAG: hypothetical protein ABI693_28965 [Bryobacteraceae bacterium]